MAQDPGRQPSTRFSPDGPPSISLPTGGGAIGGIGKKFAANPVKGTGLVTVPIAITPGPSGFAPQLSLSYDSGSGNGPFGFGWALYEYAEEDDWAGGHGAGVSIPSRSPSGTARRPRSQVGSTECECT